MIRPTPEQRRQFLDEGYVVLDEAMVDDDLLRLQAAFDVVPKRARQIGSTA